LLIILLKWTNLENTQTIFINITLYEKVAFRGVGVWLYSFLTSALDGREWSLLEITLATIEYVAGSSFWRREKSKFREVFLLPGYEPWIV